MPDEMWQIPVGAFRCINLPDLRTANPRCQNSDKGLPVSQARDLHLIDNEVGPSLMKNGGVGLHNFPAAARPFIVRMLYQSS
jgi:hypothetical protein